MRLAAGFLMLALAGVAHAGTSVGPRGASAEARHTRLVVHEASGVDARMLVEWFLPSGPGPFPVVVYAHGRDPSAAGRARVRQGIGRAQLLFWRARGVAVVVPVRPGYGGSGGADVEDPGVRFDDAGRCVGHADFARATDAAVHSLDATIAWLRTQPWAAADDVLLVGQSVGGLAAVAAAAREVPGLAGYVNFAGGAGGNADRSPGAPCDAPQLQALLAVYGQSTTVPNLWVYAQNDRFWGPDAPRDWHAVFARGGSPTSFFQAPPVPGGDGHELAAQNPRLWAAPVDEFLARLGPPWNAATAPRPVLRLDASP